MKHIKLFEFFDDEEYTGKEHSIGDQVSFHDYNHEMDVSGIIVNVSSNQYEIEFTDEVGDKRKEWIPKVQIY